MLTRRNLVKIIGFLVLGTLVVGVPSGTNPNGSGVNVLLLPSAQAQRKTTRVVVVINHQMRDKEGVFNKLQVKRTLAEAIKSLYQADSHRQALQKAFNPSQTIGLKVNTYLGQKDNATRPEIVLGLADLLISAGIPANNIIIWDQAQNHLEDVGYTINRGQQGIRCVATFTHRVKRFRKPFLGFDKAEVKVGETTTRLSRLVTRYCEVLINMPVLKTHKFQKNTGVNLAMLNMYRAIELTDKNTAALYANECNPGAAQVYSIPAIRNRTQLIICDAVYPLYNGGPMDDPRYHWKFNGIIAGFDPVAVDTVGQHIIQRYRDKKVRGWPELRSDYLTTAADPPYHLGTDNLRRIDLVEKTLR